jgi:hypothetical protein
LKKSIAEDIADGNSIRYALCKSAMRAALTMDGRPAPEKIIWPSICKLLIKLSGPKKRNPPERRDGNSHTSSPASGEHQACSLGLLTD